jgi:GH25 family lysozyme M1 (1,4-beta-N-acetylmuramidase)
MAIQNRGRAVGIYATAYMWNQILGDKTACPKFTNIPLWYAHYDSTQSFDDWTNNKFAGWTTPTIKQYNGDAVVCGFQMDVDYF